MFTKTRTIIRSKFLIFALAFALMLICLVAALTKFDDRIKGVNTESDTFPAGYEIGVWLWKSPDEISSEEMDGLLTKARRDGFTTMYVDIGKYIDITEGDKKSRVANLSKFTAANKEFITKAQAANISIQALAGSTDWSRESHSYIPTELLDYVELYNRQNPDARFVGIQYDIEFYRQSGFSENKVERSIEFLGLTRDLVDRVTKSDIFRANNFTIGFAVPFWLEGKNDTLPYVVWQERNGRFVEHFLNTLDDGRNTYIAIMAYRDTPYGQNGVMNLVSEEFDYIEKNTTNVRIIVGQETGVSEGKGTTFYGMSSKDLKKSINEVANEYQGYRAMSGFAIHDLYSYEELLP